MRHTVLAVLISPVLISIIAGPALAQGNPSAADIMRGLRPRGEGADRGIGLARPAPQAAPADAPARAPRAQQATPAEPTRAPVAERAPVAPPSVNLSVQFQTGSAELTPAARRTLDELGKALSSSMLTPYRFRIEGHTDTVGEAAANLTLSERRAAAVVTYLNARFGVDRARLEAVGMGDGAPLVPTGPQVQEPRNRRVQVLNLGA